MSDCYIYLITKDYSWNKQQTNKQIDKQRWEYQKWKDRDQWRWTKQDITFFFCKSLDATDYSIVLAKYKHKNRNKKNKQTKHKHHRHHH